MNQTHPKPKKGPALPSHRAPLDRTAEQIELTQALLREVNERIRGLNDDFSIFTGVMQIVCECGDPTCLQAITITPSEYEHLRSDPTWFAVIPGHAVAELEQIIATQPEYHVVQKRRAATAAQASGFNP